MRGLFAGRESEDLTAYNEESFRLIQGLMEDYFANRTDADRIADRIAELDPLKHWHLVYRLQTRLAELALEGVVESPKDSTKVRLL